MLVLREAQENPHVYEEEHDVEDPAEELKPWHNPEEVDVDNVKNGEYAHHHEE